MLAALLTLALAAALALAAPQRLDYAQLQGPAELERRQFNASNIAACQTIAKGLTGSGARVYYPISLQYAALSKHYYVSSQEIPTCVVYPTTAADVSVAMKTVAATRTPFAIQGGGHASNRGHSSTTGVHISLRGFQQIGFSADKSTLTLGMGLTWDQVYSQIDGSGYNDVGGRVPGVGVGGFITGGGGYSWLSNQHGLTVDTVQSFEVVLADGSVVTATEASEPELFFALKGGGNQLGVITNVVLQTRLQGMVYGGLRVYTADKLAALANATVAFQQTQLDPKAEALPTFNAVPVLGGVVLLLIFYDAPTLPSPSPFAAFDAITALLRTDRAQSFSSFVAGTPSELGAGGRGIFHTVSLRDITPPVMDAVLKEIASLQTQAAGALAISFDLEPFLLSYYQYSRGGAMPHDAGNPWLPLNIFFVWLLPTQDDYFRQLIIQSRNNIYNAAVASGQDLANLPLYPNYSLNGPGGVTGEQLFRQNLPRLRAAKTQYDPNNVFRLAGSFSF